MTSLDPRWARRFPFIDGLAGLAAGILVLLLRAVLVDFYGLSLELLTFIGWVNVAYAPLGLSLGTLRPRPAWLLWTLIAANLAWTLTCVAIAASVWPSAGVFGLVHILGEGVFVAGLALFEMRHRKELLAA